METKTSLQHRCNGMNGSYIHIYISCIIRMFIQSSHSHTNYALIEIFRKKVRPAVRNSWSNDVQCTPCINRRSCIQFGSHSSWSRECVANASVHLSFGFCQFWFDSRISLNCNKNNWTNRYATQNILRSKFLASFFCFPICKLQNRKIYSFPFPLRVSLFVCTVHIEIEKWSEKETKNGNMERDFKLKQRMFNWTTGIIVKGKLHWMNAKWHKEQCWMRQGKNPQMR